MRYRVLFTHELSEAYNMYVNGKSLRAVAAYWETNVAYLTTAFRQVYGATV